MCFPFCVCLCMCTCVSRLSIKLFLPAIFTGHLKGHPLDQLIQHICMFTVSVCRRLPSPCPTFGLNSMVLPPFCVCRTSQYQALFACNLHRSSQGHALDQSDLWGLGIETLIYHCASTSTAQPSDNALQRHKRHKRHKS